MSKRKEVTIRADRLGLALVAFDRLKGDKPVMLSYRIGRVVETLQEMQQQFVERLKPYLTEEGALREDLDDEVRVKVADDILGEELMLNIPMVSLSDLHEAGVYVEGDDTVVTFLIQHGLLSA